MKDFIELNAAKGKVLVRVSDISEVAETTEADANLFNGAKTRILKFSSYYPVWCSDEYEKVVYKIKSVERDNLLYKKETDKSVDNYREEGFFKLG